MIWQGKFLEKIIILILFCVQNNTLVSCYGCFSRRYNAPGFCVLNDLCKSEGYNFIWNQANLDQCHQNGNTLYTCCPHTLIIYQNSPAVRQYPMNVRSNSWNTQFQPNWNPNYYNVPRQSSYHHYESQRPISELTSERQHIRPLQTCGPIQTYRITNGQVASPGEFPWMALLEYSGVKSRRRFGCAGALINERFVLTAAHCITEGRKIVAVHLGVHDLNQDVPKSPKRVFGIDRIVVHPNYNRQNLQNDIALIKIQQPVIFEKHIRPICLPTLNQNIPQEEFIAGWGLTEKGSASDVLMKAAVQTSPCSMSYGSLFENEFFAGKVCAGGNQGRHTCKGDSGGALFGYDGIGRNKRFVVFGIISGGLGACSSRNKKPTMFTNVPQFLPWIEAIIREDRLWTY